MDHWIPLEKHYQGLSLVRVGVLVHKMFCYEDLRNKVFSFLDEMASLQTMKRILGKVQEMRDQRNSLEKQLRDLIQQDDITTVLVTTERADMKVWTFPFYGHSIVSCIIVVCQFLAFSQKLFEEQLKKYEQVKVYIDQNMAAQENILKALTEANVQYASVRKGLAETEQK